MSTTPIAECPRAEVMVVAHGQPSDPLPLAAELAALTERIAAFLPDWRIRSATLAEEGALARVGQDLSEGVLPRLLFPMFMASGWFTRSMIPSRLEAAGLTGWRILTPFGEAKAVQDLAVRVAAGTGAEALILAAHGSFKSPVPSRLAEAVAERIRRETDIARVDTGFIDQAPQLSTLTGFGAGTACLPFFAMAGGHVREDLPRALDEAGFGGEILPALGAHPEVPQIIAGLLQAELAATSA